jgi:hypothetical protein
MIRFQLAQLAQIFFRTVASKEVKGENGVAAYISVLKTDRVGSEWDGFVRVGGFLRDGSGWVNG